jgi:hypothetical protein
MFMKYTCNVREAIFVVAWLVLLLSIRKVPGLNLGQETGYPEGFRSFPQTLQVYSGIVPKIRP